MPVRIFWCLIQEDIFQKEAHNYYIICIDTNVLIQNRKSPSSHLRIVCGILFVESRDMQNPL